ncbi:hypothetical protein SK128_013746 [Halocaridina rubra]|uniref:Uncharacterized protein n=1 Tax=Halocaridina rubra TaxID=373956 RepID=A0AAN8XR50_HALRR
MDTNGDPFHTPRKMSLRRKRSDKLYEVRATIPNRPESLRTATANHRLSHRAIME